MKNIVLSAVAVLAMSSFSVAGGDVAPIEEPVVVPVVVDDSGFYLGLAYTALNMTADVSEGSFVDPAWNEGFDKSWSDIMVQAGYKFNAYIAVEGRYWFGLSDDALWPGYYQEVGGLPLDTSVDAWGIYVKPMYPVTEEFDVYALLGYGSTSVTINDVDYDWGLDGFSWGLGASYSFTENISAFVDYVRVTDVSEDYYSALTGTATVDTVVDTWNFGVSYKF